MFGSKFPKPFLTLALIVLFLREQSCQVSKDTEISDRNTLYHMKKLDKSSIYDWIRLYVSQHSKEYYEVKTVEDTIDQRAANLNKVQLMARYVSDDIARVDQDDPQVREEYRRFINGPGVNSEQCTRHLERMVHLSNELKEFIDDKRKGINLDTELDDEHMHLIKILDSFGRYESGLFDGRHVFPPINRECHETRLILESNQTDTTSLNDASARPFVKMRVCHASIDLSKYLDPRLKSSDDIKFSGRHEGYIRVGLCLPSTCHSSDLLHNKKLIQYLIDDQIDAPDRLFVSESWELGDDMICLNDRENIINIERSKGVLLLIALFTWLGAMVLSTYYEIELSNPQIPVYIRNIAICLNIKRSIDKLLSFGEDCSQSRIDVKRKTDRVNLEPLNSIKFLNMAAVIAVNTWLLHVARSETLVQGLSLFERSLFVRWLMGTPILVDSTFIISATLLCFAILNKLDRTGTKPLRSVRRFIQLSFREISFRYIRFVPLYFVYHWLKRNVFLRIGYGGYWDPGFNKYTLSGACKQESWWIPFTPMSAYLPLGRQCIPQAWSVGTELLAAVVIIPLTMAIQKRPQMVCVVSVLLTIAASGMTYDAIVDKINHSNAWQHLIQLDGTSVVAFFDEFSSIYVRAHHQIGLSVIGLWTGYALYLYDRGKIKDWPQWLKGAGTKAASMTTILLFIMRPLLFASGPTETVQKEQLVLHSFVSFRLLWALSNMILILRLTTDWKDILFKGRLLRGSFFKAAGKLHFAMLLIHIDLITMFAFTAEGSTATSVAIGLISEASSTYFYSFVLAVPVYVCFENPFSELIKRVIFNNIRVEKTKSKLQ